MSDRPIAHWIIDARRADRAQLWLGIAGGGLLAALCASLLGLSFALV
jgi:hypothetical protein